MGDDVGHEKNRWYVDAWNDYVSRRNRMLNAVVNLMVILLASTPATVIWLNNWRIDDNDQRYVKREEAFMVAQAAEVKTQVAELQKAQTEQSTKLDELGSKLGYIEVQSAMAMVSNLQEKVTEHRRKQEQSIEWELEHARLERRVERAQAFADCLLNTPSLDCDKKKDLIFSP